MRQAVGIELSESEQKTLRSWSRSRTAPARLVSRAKIILLASLGQSNTAIAAELAMDRTVVGRWRIRFAEDRLDGIEHERPGRGRKPVRKRRQARRIIETTLHETPRNATHWSIRSLAEHLKIAPAMVQRVWREHNLHPHRVETFKLSTDPQFIEKIVDVVGLYLRPPDHALVFCVDEKSQIQALDRTQPGLPLKRGRCGTMTHDYKRHGTTTLFAAMEMAEGRLIGKCMKRHRHQEWIKFLKLIDAQAPADYDVHLIADNYCTHKHAKVKVWLERHPRFHLHFIPTSSSWLNMIERWFRDITTKRLRRSTFRSVEALEEAIYAYIEDHNATPKPFTWTADLKDILPKIARAHQTLDTMQNQ
jgi:transposase